MLPKLGRSLLLQAASHIFLLLFVYTVQLPLFAWLHCSTPSQLCCCPLSRHKDTFVPEGVRILCINDCCHSGTICDIDSFMYTHDIYSISAALDHEEAEDVGEGGVLSCALRRAVRTLSVEHGRTWVLGHRVYVAAFVLRFEKEHVKLGDLRLLVSGYTVYCVG